jgi:hypothetical protein
MKQDMGSVRDESIALRQKGVGIAKHDPVASCPFRFRSKKIGYPPGTKLTDKKQTITDPKPIVKPMGIGLPEIQQAVEQANSKRHTLNESDDNKTCSCVLAANRSNVIQSPKRNPIVYPEKKHLESLKYKQNDFCHQPPSERLSSTVRFTVRS